jgi:hypothetical protein
VAASHSSGGVKTKGLLHGTLPTNWYLFCAPVPILFCVLLVRFSYFLVLYVFPTKENRIIHQQQPKGFIT